MYGITIMSAGHGTARYARAADVAREAESAGFATVWTSELYNRSATVQLANLALGTSTVRLGTNIAYGVGRTPLMWAAEARDLDELSDGRLILGLGNGTPGMMENWHGVSGQTPVVRMRDFIEVLRKLWRLDLGPVHHDGPFYTVHLVPTSETLPPCQERLPIWIAGINTKMVALAGETADGLVGHPMFSGTYVREVVRPELAAAATAHGRDPASVSVMGILMCSVDPDEELARRRLAFAIGQYAASRVYDRLFALHGWSADQERIREAAKAGDDDALVAAVPDEAIDAIGVACGPDELAERVALHAVDYDHLDLVVPAWGLAPEESEAQTRGLIDAMRPALRAAAPV